MATRWRADQGVTGGPRPGSRGGRRLPSTPASGCRRSASAIARIGGDTLPMMRAEPTPTSSKRDAAAGRPGEAGHDRPTEAERLASSVERTRSGGAPKYHQKLAEQGKLFVRERLR